MSVLDEIKALKTRRDKENFLSRWCDAQDCGACMFDNNGWCVEFTEWTLPDTMLDKVIGEISEYEELVGGDDTNDVVNHPSHYCRQGAMECIDEMIEIFGIEPTMHFCQCNAWKYRYRASKKNGEEDLKKSDWYIRKYAELKVRLKMEASSIGSKAF